MDKIQSLTGMLDLYNDGDRDNLSVKVFEVEKVLKRIFSIYQLNEMRTPALEDTDFECIKDVLAGPTLLALSEVDPGAAARVLKDFAKENDDFEIKALSVGGKLLDANQIDVLAKLPTLDQARSMLMSVMLAPITKLARTANEVPSKVTRVVAAVRDQKKEAA